MSVAFERVDRAFLAERGVLGCKVALVLELAFAALDWILVPELFARFLVYRIAAAGVLMAGILAYRRVGPRLGYGYAFYAAAVVGVMIDLLIVDLGGHRSPYYAGLNLVILGVGLIAPAPPGPTLIMALFVHGSYIVTVALGDDVVDWKVFIANNCFIATTSILTVIAARYNYRKRVAEFEAARALADANARLLETDRLKSEFFANVSHEIRTPLTLNVLPLAALLEGRAGALNAGQRDLVETLERNAGRLRALVDDLLDFARLEAGRLPLVRAPIDLRDLATSAAELFEPALVAKGLALRRTLPEEPVLVSGDRSRLEKVVANLLANAYKFTERGEVGLSVGRRNGSAVVEVRDTGVGIPGDALPRIFDRFYQVDGSATRRHEGTGIGLSLARELARLHGGDLTCASEVGRGSTFTVALPLASNGAQAAPREMGARSPLREVAALIDGGRRAVAAAADASAGAAPRGGRPRVLVAEDNADLGAELVRLLGAEVDARWVRDGDAALAAARTFAPDVAILDVMMPGRTGVEVTRALKGDPELRRIPVLLLSARSLRGNVVGGLEAGADDYVTKPFDPDVLVSKVGALLRIRRLEDELVRSERLRAVTELVIALKHEILNPLTGIVALLDVTMAEATALKPDERAALGRVKELAFKIARVVERAEQLREASTVTYVGDERMIDLRAAAPAQNRKE